MLAFLHNSLLFIPYSVIAGYCYKRGTLKASLGTLSFSHEKPTLVSATGAKISTRMLKLMTLPL
jgi:hypothetical protein